MYGYIFKFLCSAFGCGLSWSALFGTLYIFFWDILLLFFKFQRPSPLFKYSLLSICVCLSFWDLKRSKYKHFNFHFPFLLAFLLYFLLVILYFEWFLKSDLLNHKLLSQLTSICYSIFCICLTTFTDFMPNIPAFLFLHFLISVSYG